MGLMVLPFLVLWDVATFQKILVAGDILEYNYPIQYLITQQIRSGILPLWNNRLSSGIPLFGLSQAGTLYPLNFVFAILPPWIAMTYLLLVHYSLAGVFTYAYVRQLGTGRRGAFVAGIVYMFSGFLVGHLGHLSMVRTAVWLPAILWAVEKWRKSLDAKSILIGAIAVAMAIFGVHPQMTFYVCGVVALYIGWFTMIARPGCPRPKFLIGGVSIFGLGALLALPQLLLSLETYTALARPTSGYEYFTTYSLHPLLLSQLVFPAILRSNWLMPEIIGYVGILPLVLAVLAALRWKHSAKCFFALLAVGATLLVLGRFTPLYRLMYHVPLYNAFRVPPRNWLEFDFAIAVLAGAGFDIILLPADHERHLVRRYLIGTAGGLVALALAIGGLVAFGLPFLPALFPSLATRIQAVAGTITLAVPATQAALAVILVSAGVVLLLAYTRKCWYMAALAVGLIVGDQYTSYSNHLFTIHSVRKTPAEVFGYVPGSVQFLRSDHSLYRTLTYSPHHKYNLTELQNILYSDLNVIYDIDSANNYDAMFLQQYAAFTDYSITNNGSVIGPGIFRPNSSQILSLLNVKYIIVPVSTELPVLGFQVVDGIKFESTPYPWLALGPQDLTEATFTMPQQPMTTLAIASALEGGGNLAEGQKVARVTIVDVAEQRHVYDLLAGLHTAELTYDCVGTPAQYPRPQVAYDRLAGDAGGTPCTGHLYLAHLDIEGAPIIPQQVAIEYLADTGRIYIDKMTLYDATTGLSYPFSVAQGYLGYLLNSEIYRFVYQDRYVRIFENKRVLPRAFLVPQAVQVEGPAEANQIVRTGQLPDGSPFDPAAVALVEVSDSAELPGTILANVIGRSRHEARIVSTRPGRVEIVTAADSAAFLVYSENYFPGWRATSDGVRTSVYRTDGTLMGLVVPAGTHRIVLTFTPPPLYYGLSGSVAALLLMAGLALRRTYHGSDLCGSPSI
jgi:hypothetical protein